MTLPIEYKQYIEDVRQLISKAVSYNSPQIENIIKSIPFYEGKNIRALMLFAFARIAKNNFLTPDQYDKCIHFGAVIELLHLSTLIHDDVIDNADIRRGITSINASFDNRKAILSGDLVFATSFRLMSVKDDCYHLIRLVSRACEDLVCGEIEEEVFVNNYQLSKAEYIDIIKKKTASLFQCACAVGAAISNPELEKYASDFGLNFGLSFQIIDDKIDYFSTTEESGKPQYADIRGKKFTLPAILLYEKSSETEKNHIADIFAKDYSINESQIQNLIKMMERYDIHNDIKEYANKYLTIAKNNLLLFPESQDRKNILSLVNDLYV